MNKRKKTKRTISKTISKKLDKVHRKYDEIFKDDEILLAKLRREINI